MEFGSDSILTGGDWASGFGYRASAQLPKRSDEAVVSDWGEGLAEARGPLGLRLKSVTAVGAIRWGVANGDAIIAAKCSTVASIESWVHGPRA